MLYFRFNIPQLIFLCSRTSHFSFRPKDLQGLLISSINFGTKSYLLKIFGIALAGLFICLLVVCSYYLWLGFQRFKQDLIHARYLTLILLGVQITSIVVTFIQVMLLLSAFALQMCWRKFASYGLSPVKALLTFKKNYTESFTGNQLQAMHTESFGTADADTFWSWIRPSLGWIGDYLRFKDIMRVYFYFSLVAILFSIGGFGIYIG